MASGHVNRVKRPNTWLHRPMLQNMKKALANPEPDIRHRKSGTGGAVAELVLGCYKLGIALGTFSTRSHAEA
jgi:hypothetical protein